MATHVATGCPDAAPCGLQAHAQWAAPFVLEPPGVRRAILQLSHPTCGMDTGNLGYGLQRYLKPYFSTTLGVISWLEAPHQRQLLQPDRRQFDRVVLQHQMATYVPVKIICKPRAGKLKR